ncbi:MAG: nitrogen fixation protein [Dehalococcoidia bacterium]
MNDKPRSSGAPLCPSAQPQMAGSVVLGIVQGTAREPRLAHLVRPLPVTGEILALSEPVKPTEVFRFAAPCAGSACLHFDVDGASCRLVTRVVELLPAVTDDLPTCRIRPDCRWWQQEGRAACMRCPRIVTETYHPSDVLARAAGE